MEDNIIIDENEEEVNNQAVDGRVVRFIDEVIPHNSIAEIIDYKSQKQE